MPIAKESQVFFYTPLSLGIFFLENHWILLPKEKMPLVKKY
jgi:hypothetical protein